MSAVIPLPAGDDLPQVVRLIGQVRTLKAENHAQFVRHADDLALVRTENARLHAELRSLRREIGSAA